MTGLKQYNFFKVELVSDNRVLVVTINRPPVNAFIKESYEELRSIISFANQNTEISTLLLKADGRMFSAGADVKQLAIDAQDSAATVAARRVLLRKSAVDLHNCEVAVVVAVHGAVIGIGAVFAACGDIIVAADDAYFSIPEINIGLVGAASGLTRLVPPQKVRAMAFTGSKVPVADIYQYGGIEAVVPKEELNATALDYAVNIANKGTAVVRKWKEALVLTEGMRMGEAAIVESNLSGELVKEKVTN
jgi:enoyl-CoA hydratase